MVKQLQIITDTETHFVIKTKSLHLQAAGEASAESGERLPGTEPLKYYTPGRRPPAAGEGKFADSPTIACEISNYIYLSETPNFLLQATTGFACHPPTLAFEKACHMMNCNY